MSNQPQWRKSSFSGDGGSNCVEVAELLGDAIAVRNSQHPERGTLTFNRDDFAAFLDATKAGEFDNFA